MAVKYHCPKCEKRFIEWGAEKLGFKCPDCKEETLVRIGASESGSATAKPSLKRRVKKAVVADVPVSIGGYGDDDDPKDDVDEFAEVGVDTMVVADDFADDEAIAPVEPEAEGDVVVLAEEDAPAGIFDAEIDDTEVAADVPEPDEDV